jgi:polysaccharide biosynthesis transport protein
VITLYSGLSLLFTKRALIQIIGHAGLPLHSREETEKALGYPVIGVLPFDKNIQEALKDGRSGPTEAIRALRNYVQIANPGLPRSLLVTSSLPSEGKTTISVALAKSFSEIGLNVLLIDADLRNPTVRRRMRLSNYDGLSCYLSGYKSADEVLQASDFQGLFVITSGPMRPNPAELLTGKRLNDILEMASQSFDITIVDGPPTMGLADSPTISSKVDATIIIVAAGKNHRGYIRTALRRLHEHNANIRGVILSQYKLGKGLDFDYFGYGYHQYESDSELE